MIKINEKMIVSCGAESAHLGELFAELAESFLEKHKTPDGRLHEACVKYQTEVWNELRIALQDFRKGCCADWEFDCH